MNNNIAGNSFHKNLYNHYEHYCEQTISSNRIVHKEINQLLEKIKQRNLFTVKRLGESIEGRDINLISFGKGKTNILAWTQMHGDEPTATAAVSDVLNFFSSDDEFKHVRDSILSNVTIHIIPMLNPDGAEKHQRENSINIDINRDASRAESPESKILLDAARSLKPDFGFNLHDQNSYYTAGKANRTAAISLLAPPFDYDKSISEARTKSMKAILHIFNVLSEYIPGHIARYSDDFEPRAFGDRFTKMGISSILIESGFIKGDYDKSEIRKLNFVALLSVFYSIAEKHYETIDSKKYFEIPENESLLFDLLLRNLSLNGKDKSYKIDVGINREKYFDPANNTFYHKGKIEQIGDLSVFYGIEEYDFSGLMIELPLITNNYYNLKDIYNLDFNKLYCEKIAFLRLKEGKLDASFTKLPINIITRTKSPSLWLKSDEMANFVVIKKGKVRFIIINGFFKDLSNSENSIHNGWVID